jgi:hypothetical protein
MKQIANKAKFISLLDVTANVRLRVIESLAVDYLHARTTGEESCAAVDAVKEEG